MLNKTCKIILNLNKQINTFNVDWNRQIYFQSNKKKTIYTRSVDKTFYKSISNNSFSWRTLLPLCNVLSAILNTWYLIVMRDNIQMELWAVSLGIIQEWTSASWYTSRAHTSSLRMHVKLVQPSWFSPPWKPGLWPCWVTEDPLYVEWTECGTFPSHLSRCPWARGLIQPQTGQAAQKLTACDCLMWPPHTAWWGCTQQLPAAGAFICIQLCLKNMYIIKNNNQCE